MVAYGIHHTGKATVSVVVRSEYQKIKTKGFRIESVDYGKVDGWIPEHVYPSPEAAAEQTYDFVVLATKNIPDVSSSADLVEPVVKPGTTTIVLMQNGFGLERAFFEKYPKNVCVLGVSHIGSHSLDGVIHHTHIDKTYISYFKNPNIPESLQEQKTKDFISIYSNERNSCTYTEDAKEYRYRKLVYNATLNTTAAVTGADVGRLELSGALETIVIPAMREVKAVALADGVELPEDIIDSMIRCNDGTYFLPSMLVDVRKGNVMELEVILGSLLQRAAELGVRTPVLSTLYSLLRVVQFRLKEGKGLVTVPEKRPITDKVWS